MCRLGFRRPYGYTACLLEVIELRNVMSYMDAHVREFFSIMISVLKNTEACAPSGGG